MLASCDHAFIGTRDAAILLSMLDTGARAVELPNAPCLLSLCDCGGSKGYRSRLWKAQLQEKLADTLGMTVIVCHYPTGASKWKPIQHRLFGPISINWAAKPLRRIETMLACIRGTTTNLSQERLPHLVVVHLPPP